MLGTLMCSRRRIRTGKPTGSKAEYGDISKRYIDSSNDYILSLEDLVKTQSNLIEALKTLHQLRTGSL
jgi:hypothetical protein